jgi:hypothetical protein
MSCLKTRNAVVSGSQLPQADCFEDVAGLVFVAVILLFDLLLSHLSLSD